ncbi:MAG: DNA alkylation repair protein [Blautia sp.]|nr:DNA alkylation repair protein [Blautia sp.]MDD7730546.1 DNA alkylation repair protein [Clostridia bacterium]MDY5663498.1 DNA alkylation repair protein [Blautia sp.]
MQKEKVTAQEVRQRLIGLADEGYREFHGGLLPGTDNIMGVRLPKLRALAKELSQMDWKEWFAASEDVYYEETMLRGLTIAYAKMDYKSRLEYIQRFVPCIRNWAVCDCFCNTLKDAGKHQAEYWEFLEPYFSSDQEYEARFGAVMLLSHFVKREYLDGAISRLESIRQEGYYAKMAVAWALSVYFVAFPREVLEYLQGGHHLDEFTYRKTLQKILESYRVDKETKAIIREMRQKG